MDAEDVPLWGYGLLALAAGLLGAAVVLRKARPGKSSAPLLAGSAGAAILLALTIVYALG
jgi:hypothetical protein